MIYGTPLLRQMIFNDVLSGRLSRVGIKDRRIHKWLSLLDNGKAGGTSFIPGDDDLKKLSAYRLISSKPFDCLKRTSEHSIPLPFVSAVNLELTYTCNLECSHCLQTGLRKMCKPGWMSTDLAARVIREAWFAGIISSGINFTGGEVFMPESNLPELLEITNSLNIPVRVNTNGWWGRKRKIIIGSHHFVGPEAVIAWLKSNYVHILALSFDDRYIKYPALWKSVVRIMKECISEGLPFQLVSTGTKEAKLEKKLADMAIKEKIPPEKLILVPMDMVDIGGDFPGSGEILDDGALKSLKFFSSCMNRGFTRPQYLHISPDGGVRTCMYAPGSSALGNVSDRSLLHIINHFIDNPVVRLFRHGDLEEFVHKFFTPHLDQYRNVSHPCAGSALISRFAEMLHNSDSDVLSIHQQIAEEFNLTPS